MSKTPIEKLLAYGTRRADGFHDGTLFRFKDAGHFFLADADLPMEMRLCETRHVQLKPNRPYIFTVDPECPMCVGLNEQSKQAERILKGLDK
jgi:hypothetical protein